MNRKDSLMWIIVVILCAGICFQANKITANKIKKEAEAQLIANIERRRVINTQRILIKTAGAKIIEADVPISNDRIKMKAINDFCEFIRENNITVVYHGIFDVVPYVFLSCEGYYYEVNERWYVYQIEREWLKESS